MHYYKKEIGNYHRKAGRLNILQHGVFNLLIDACYDREMFPTEAQAIDWIWAESPEEIAAVKFVLKKFFVMNEEGIYIQNHIQEDLAAYKAFKTKQSENGKQGGRPKGSTNKPKTSDDSGQTQENPTGSEINPPLNQENPTESQKKPKPITINQEPLTNNQDSNGNNASEEKVNFVPIQFATYKAHDKEFYSLLELASEHSQFQMDFIDLAVPRHESISSTDFQTLLQDYCDFFAAKNDKNTPSIWFVKWLTWIQNNIQDVIKRREKQTKANVNTNQPAKGYFERILDEEQSANTIVDVTPSKKLIASGEYGHA
jgi:uncharacterized protein YdaU (DUF1376 family)